MGDVAAAASSGATTNGAMLYRSIQGVTLPDTPGALESWGQPESLARMMRSYFTVAENCAARMVRVHWTVRNRPTIFLAWPSVVMIGMDEATFESSADRRAIHAGVTGGLLVMPRARPHLVIALERRPEGVHASVDLLDYQPRWGDSAVVRWIYRHTQVPVHVVVGRLYLRQLRQAWGGGPLRTDNGQHELGSEARFEMPATGRPE
jgi:hypothetical protein